MKILIVYYSYEGDCAFIADKIKELRPDADVLRLATEDDKPRGFFAKYVWGGKQVLSGKKPALKSYNIDINEYEFVVIGTPVWAGSYTPAIASFIADTKIEGKTIALFCCHAGGKGKTLEKLKSALTGNTFTDAVDFLEPKKHTAGVQEKLNWWVKSWQS
ncbi:MAG: NAD(P)H-dependent oxidoreductase [Spirochaetaceae bacterium]|jgi:flavodoxin|nr:NAD(P)H-dependent oxidoreductase [Spirochaetaceae bacterium]